MFIRPLKYRILSFLNKNRDQWFDISDIANSLKISNQITSTISILERDNFVHKDTHRKRRVYAISELGAEAVRRRGLFEKVRNTIAFMLTVLALIVALKSFMPTGLPSEVTINFTPSQTDHTPPHTAGDLNLKMSDGDWVNTEAKCVFLVDSAKALYARIYFDAMESYSNGNVNSRYGVSLDNQDSPWSTWHTIFTIPDSLKNYRIQLVTPITESLFLDAFHYPQTGRIGNLTGQTVLKYEESISNEDSPQPKVTVYWNALTIQLALKDQNNFWSWLASFFDAFNAIIAGH